MSQALKGRIHRADNALLQSLGGRVSSSPGRCPGLYYVALSGQQYMKILAINPNTSESFNRQLEATAQAYVLNSTEVTVISPATGPKSIEGIFDEALSIPGTMQAFLEREEEFDAFILACFSDPLAVYAMREYTTKPVLGIAEAAIYTACMLDWSDWSVKALL